MLIGSERLLDFGLRFYRGNAQAGLIVVYQGPRLFSHGYMPFCVMFVPFNSRFQWGHDFSAMDTVLS